MTNEELIAKIKAEIERQQKENVNYDENGGFASYCDHSTWLTLESMLTFVSGLEETEKPMNQDGLEQEIIKCWQEWVSPSNKQSVEGVLPLSEFAFFARHFAEWGAEHLKK